MQPQSPDKVSAAPQFSEIFFCLFVFCLNDSSTPRLLGAHPPPFYTVVLSLSSSQTGLIVDARLKELTPTMPVIFIRAIPVDKQESRNVYQCPVYKTRQRGPTYVWTFNLKTKENPSKWTLAGVALLLQI